MAVTTARIELPPKLVPVFKQPRGSLRYRGAYGGRGSGKSMTFALMAAVFGYAEPLRILATRDLQVSIKESFYAEVKAAIESTPWLSAHYEVGESYIRGRNGTEFIFRGLRHNIQAIKSMAQIDLCIIEEAEDVPEHSWRDLIPTIRAPNSEVWVIWNPRIDGSPCDSRFKKEKPRRSMIVELNYEDNPFFPAELDEERQNDRDRLGDAEYLHIWRGHYLKNSEAEIMAGKWRIAAFEPKPFWHGPYHGLDFGFAQDPTAAVKCWVCDDVLYIEREAGSAKLELDDTAEYMEQRIPGIAEHVVRADSARPESISYLKRHGMPHVTAVNKWSGSVEDGIKFLRSFREIVIHERCTEMQNEAVMYRYKVDKQTGDVLPQVVDAYNHYWDAVRYALAPMIKKKGAPKMRQL